MLHIFNNFTDPCSKILANGTMITTTCTKFNLSWFSIIVNASFYTLKFNRSTNCSETFTASIEYIGMTNAT